MSCTCNCIQGLPRWANLPTSFTGSTAAGVNFMAEGEGVNAKLFSVEMTVFDTAGLPVLVLSDPDGMQITESFFGRWEFQMRTIQDLTLPKGAYSYRVETTDTEGNQVIYYQGIWEIK